MAIDLQCNKILDKAANSERIRTPESLLQRLEEVALDRTEKRRNKQVRRLALCAASLLILLSVNLEAMIYSEKVEARTSQSLSEAQLYNNCYLPVKGIYHE